MAVVQNVAADLDGDGQAEIVQGTDDRQTLVLKNNNQIWASGTPLNGPGGGWNRNAIDLFGVADVDGDRREEIVIANNSDNWTGVLKWQDAALQPIWMSPSPLNGPAGGWNRGADLFVASDLDGDGLTEIVIANNNDGWTGVLKWQGGGLQPIWMSPTPLKGPAGDWNRRAGDVFAAVGASIYVTGPNGWHGVLAWQGGALGPVQITKDKDTKEQSKDDKDNKDSKDKDDKDQKDKEEKDVKDDKDQKEDKDAADAGGVVAAHERIRNPGTPIV